MRYLNYNEKLSLIKKHYKKYSTFLELYLINYEKYNMYICINKINDKYYRLSWFDLSNIKDKNIENYVSCELISSEYIDIIKEEFSKYIVSSHYHEDNLKEDNKVILKANIKTKEEDDIDISFKRYLPKKLQYLSDLIIFIFRHMPKKYEAFLFEILAKLTNTTERYEYKDEFDFDLFEGDIDKLFSNQICQRGKQYFEESRIRFLEKIDDRYFAVVDGTEKYLTIIKYDEKEKKMEVYCSCPCEFYCKHMYAVILAIRNNQFNHFYKIMYENPDKNMYEIVTEFEYFLCLGVVDKYLEIINHYGEFELVPILDENNKYNWLVLEDSEDEILTKQIKKYLDN